MPTAALLPSAAVGRLLRGRRRELGLTLAEVTRRLARRGERVPLSTLARVEQGKLDPGVRRLHRLVRLYDLPPPLVADILDLEESSAEIPASDDLETLYREGTEHWRRGDLARGMACLLALRRAVPKDEASRLLKHKAMLVFAGAARDVGKLDVAEQTVHTLLREPLAPELRVPVLVLAASVWRALGSVEAALAFVGQAEARLTRGDSEQRGWVLHQKARVLMQDDRNEAALRAAAAARAAYRASGNTFDEGKLVVLQAEIHAAAGRLDRAVATARRAVAMSAAHGHAQVELHARIVLGGLLVRCGRARAALEALRQSLAQAVLLADRQGEFLCHYHLWKAHAALHDDDGARVELESAFHYARFVHAALPEAEEVRRLLQPGVSDATAEAVRSRDHDR